MSASSRPTRRAGAVERHREVGGDGALADAALAAHHEDDVLHVGDRIFAGDVARNDPHFALDLDSTGARLGERSGDFGDELLFLGSRRRGEDQRERDLPGRIDRYVFHEVVLDEASTEFGVFHLGEGFECAFEREGHLKAPSGEGR